MPPQQQGFNFTDYIAGAWNGLTPNTGYGTGNYGSYQDPSGASVNLNETAFNAINNSGATGEGLGTLKLNSDSFKSGAGLGNTFGNIANKAGSVFTFGKGVYDLWSADKNAKQAQDNFDKQFGLQKHQQQNIDNEISRVNKQRTDNRTSYNKKSTPKAT